MDSAEQTIIGSGTLRVGSLAGVSIRLHFTFVILFVVLLFSSTGSPLDQAVYMLALFGSVVVHELGHAAVSRAYGIQTLEIVMFPVGGVALRNTKPTARQDLWISLAGPFTNLVIACGLLLWQYQTVAWAGTVTAMQATDLDLISKCILANMSLAIFNLLPAFPMDGGKALRGALSLFQSEAQAARLASIIGRTIAIALGLFGLIIGNYLLAFVAVFVYFGAAQENAVLLGRSLLEGALVREAMVTEFETLPHGATVGDAAKRLLATSQQDFPVVVGPQVVGLLSRNLLLGAMAADGPDTYVAGAMNRDFVRLNPEMDLADALPLIAQSGSCALVLESDSLVGLLTTENLTEFLVLRRIGIEKGKQEPVEDLD